MYMPLVLWSIVCLKNEHSEIKRDLLLHDIFRANNNAAVFSRLRSLADLWATLSQSWGEHLLKFSSSFW
jgi:hypothetical protein